MGCERNQNGPAKSGILHKLIRLLLAVTLFAATEVSVIVYIVSRANSPGWSRPPLALESVGIE